MQKQTFYAPHPLLRNHIRYFWTFRYNRETEDEIPLRIMADRFPKLILQNKSCTGGIRESAKQMLPQSFILGIITRPRTYSICREYAHLGVSFYPDAPKRIFDIPCQELTDSYLDFSRLLPGREYESICGAGNIQETIARITRFFLARINSGSLVPDGKVIRNILKQTTGFRNASVRTMASDYGVSERSIERKFRDLVGVSPKKYLQILRFEHSYKRLTSQDFETFSQLGYEAGFSDQSHFIRSFKQFSGMLPTTYLEEMKREKEGAGVVIWNYTRNYTIPDRQEVRSETYSSFP